MRPLMLEMGLASGAELEELDAAPAHLEDPLHGVSGLFYLVWERKPSATRTRGPA